MPRLLENKTFDEIKVGDSASHTRVLTKNEIEIWAAVTRNVNLAQLHKTPDRSGLFKGVIGHGIWGAALFATVVGTHLPGPGTTPVQTSIRFVRPLIFGTEVTATVTVEGKDPAKKTVLLNCRCTDQEGRELIAGTVEVIAPTDKIVQPWVELPKVQLQRNGGTLELREACKDLAPVSTAVVHPCDDDALLGPLHAAEQGLIDPILIGPERKIRDAAAKAEMDIDRYRLIATEHSHAAAETAVAMVRAGEAEALMKGSLHTDELMHEVIRKDTGLRTARRISHAFVIAVPTFARPLILTDAAINIYPTLEDKRDICQNAIDLAHVLGLEQPRVAILSAVETVTPRIPSTLDAAALCKMADRGQISGGLLDGPLAFDNAIDEAAARTKGIFSAVAGRADILVVPDLEAGNMLAKQLTFMADADAAGIVLGARAPIILTSRADSVRIRVASCALAVLFAHEQRKSLAAQVAK
jgi:phosphate acetyltransferase